MVSVGSGKQLGLSFSITTPLLVLNPVKAQAAHFNGLLELLQIYLYGARNTLLNISQSFSHYHPSLRCVSLLMLKRTSPGRNTTVVSNEER